MAGVPRGVPAAAHREPWARCCIGGGRALAELRGRSARAEKVPLSRGRSPAPEVDGKVT